MSYHTAPKKYLLLTLFAFAFLLAKVVASYSPSAAIPNKKKNKAVGDYNGDGKKESILDNRTDEDPICYSKVYFSDKKIEPILDTGVFVSTVLNEGNLDQTPGDEFTVYYGSCEAGEWLGGVLYSVHDNQCKVRATFSVYRNVSSADFVYKDPLDPHIVIVEEDYWSGDTLAVRKKKIVLK